MPDADEAHRILQKTPAVQGLHRNTDTDGPDVFSFDLPADYPGDQMSDLAGELSLDAGYVIEQAGPRSNNRKAYNAVPDTADDDEPMVEVNRGP